MNTRLPIVLSLFLFLFSPLYSSDYSLILERNIFSPIPPAPVETGAEEIPEKQVERIPAPAELFMLYGTMIFRDAPGENIAIIELIRQGETGFFKAGDSLGDARIISIDDGIVTMEYGYQRHILAEYGSYLAPVRADSEYILEIGPLMERAEDELEIMAGISFVSVENEESRSGLTPRGIPRESLLYDYGVRDGDLITRINTVDIRNPQDALHAYEKIMRHGIRRVVVELYREGALCTHVYRLR